MYGCESWIIKEAQCQRIDAFELCCWRRLLRAPWTARRSNQSILKGISLGCSLEGLMLKLKLQYFGHLMRRTDSLEKTLMLGKIEGRRRSGRQRIRQLDGIPAWWTWIWASSGGWWWTGKLGVLQSMVSQRVRRDWVTELNYAWVQVFPCPKLHIHTGFTPYLLEQLLKDISWVTVLSKTLNKTLTHNFHVVCFSLKRHHTSAIHRIHEMNS